MNTLTHDTVLEHWFRPMQSALDKTRYSDKVFPTLNMPAFLLFGCLRQLQSQTSLRDQIQSLMHLDDAEKAPLARSTWSDALASKKRASITQEAFSHLVNEARAPYLIGSVTYQRSATGPLSPSMPPTKRSPRTTAPCILSKAAQITKKAIC